MKSLLLTFLLATTSIATAFAEEAPPLVLVDKGKAEAVIVTADEPSPSAQYASQELFRYIKKATGADLRLVKESNAPVDGVKIFIGATKAAEKAGLTQNVFKGEDYVIKTIGENLYIVGRENEQPVFVDMETTKGLPWAEFRPIMLNNGLVEGTRRGTLYGVYAFLDRFLGVKWLWPGDIGTYVPKTDNLAVSDAFETRSGPVFDYRRYRIWGVLRPVPSGTYKGLGERSTQLAFSQDGLKHYGDALREYLVVHQAGCTKPKPSPGHIFGWWWGKHGKEHADWFAMRDDGTRGPGADGKTAHVRMCVSNPGLAEFMVEEFWDGGDILSVGEADHRGFCRCATCMEWDEPQPEGFRGYSTTNRYVRFAQKLHAMAVKRNPNVRIAMLLYMDYTHAPTIDVNLSFVYGEFVPWGSGFECYYPMSEAAAQANKDAWLGWSKTGMEMVYRPNYLLSGYTLPALELEQTGDMIKHAARHGMRGFDYDSLWGFWATKGPMLYMHMRLGTNPALLIDDIKNEYYSAFGPAAEAVENYFDYWIEYTKTLPRGGVRYSNALDAADLYPPEVFNPAEKLLETALVTAKRSDDPEFAQRVEFLQNGLRHAKLSTRFARLYKEQEFEKALDALNELIAFRSSHERDFIADYAAAVATESRTYADLEQFLAGKFMNFSDPGFQSNDKVGTRKIFKREDVHEINNLVPGKWGLILSEGAESGFVSFKYEAEDGNSFVEAWLEPYARSGGTLSNVLEFSTDGAKYHTVAENIGKQKIDLTEYTKGKSVFYLRLRFEVVKRLETEQSKLALVNFKVSYAKRFPDKKQTRPQLEVGTGWLDFGGTWTYRKDVEDKGLAAADMSPDTFSGDGWTAVEVPARLSGTAVGPYLGYGWYAVTFDVQKDWAARDVEFLFEGIDEQAWVYLNGTKIGEHSTASEGVGVGVLWNEPFIVRASADDVKAGEKNLLQVKTHASRGEHGIWKPVKIRPVDASNGAL